MAIIARGGFGEVVKVKSQATKEIYALKKVTTFTDKEIQMAVREWTMLYLNKHPNIIGFEGNFQIYIDCFLVQFRLFYQ